MPDQKNNLNKSSASNEQNSSSLNSGKKHFDVSFFYTWCKACGICAEFCPKGIITKDKTGKPQITDSEGCIGCLFCEKHCPDFAITVEVRMPKRRKTDE